MLHQPGLKRGHGHGMPCGCSAMSLAAQIGSSGHWPKAIATLHQAQLSAPVEERDYAAAITSCIQSLQWTWALRLLAEAASTGLKLGEPTWNKIVSAAGRKKAWQAALALFEQYLENGAAWQFNLSVFDDDNFETKMMVKRMATKIPRKMTTNIMRR